MIKTKNQRGRPKGEATKLVRVYSADIARMRKLWGLTDAESLRRTLDGNSNTVKRRDWTGSNQGTAKRAKVRTKSSPKGRRVCPDAKVPPKQG